MSNSLDDALKTVQIIQGVFFITLAIIAGVAVVVKTKSNYKAQDDNRSKILKLTDSLIETVNLFRGNELDRIQVVEEEILPTENLTVEDGMVNREMSVINGEGSSPNTNRSSNSSSSVVHIDVNSVEKLQHKLVEFREQI